MPSCHVTAGVPAAAVALGAYCFQRRLADSEELRDRAVQVRLAYEDVSGRPAWGCTALLSALNAVLRIAGRMSQPCTQTAAAARALCAPPHLHPVCRLTPQAGFFSSANGQLFMHASPGCPPLLAILCE